MPSWPAAATGIITLSCLVMIASGYRQPRMRAEYRAVLSEMRWWMLPAGVGSIALLLGTIYLLMKVPGLSWGWWKLLGGSGNAMAGQTGFHGTGWRLMALAVPVALALAMPSLALTEERIFRDGSEQQTWGQRIFRQLKFGLLHSLLAGVPLAAGLALTLAGLYFTQAYLSQVPRSHTQSQYPDADQVPRATLTARRAQALNAAAAAHAIQNWIVLTVVIVAAFGRILT